MERIINSSNQLTPNLLYGVIPAVEIATRTGVIKTVPFGYQDLMQTCWEIGPSWESVSAATIKKGNSSSEGSGGFIQLFNLQNQCITAHYEIRETHP